MEQAGAFPDVVIGCVGGGSNFAGLAFPFLREKIAGREIDVLACEPAACPTLTRGLFAYDFGDTSKLTPLVPMHTLGHDFIPAPIHAGGLRYHGVAPLISQLVRDGLDPRRGLPPARRASPPPSSSRAARGSSRRPSRRTRSTARSRPRGRPTRRARRRRSSSTSPATATSTWPPTTTTSRGKLEDVALDEAEIERALAAIEGLPTSGLASSSARFPPIQPSWIAKAPSPCPASCGCSRSPTGRPGGTRAAARSSSRATRRSRCSRGSGIRMKPRSAPSCRTWRKSEELRSFGDRRIAELQRPDLRDRQRRDAAVEERVVRPQRLVDRPPADPGGAGVAVDG